MCIVGTYSRRQVQKKNVGLIFLRYISGAFEKQYRELVGFEDERDAYAMDNVFLSQKRLGGKQ